MVKKSWLFCVDSKFCLYSSICVHFVMENNNNGLVVTKLCQVHESSLAMRIHFMNWLLAYCNPPPLYWLGTGNVSKFIQEEAFVNEKKAPKFGNALVGVT